MAYSVKADATQGINLAPSSLVEEVMQNIAVLISTLKGTVPLDRELGIDSSFLDKQMAVAEAIIVSEVMDAIERYEPRAEVLEVTFERDERTGKLIPRVEVEIHAG